MEKMEKTNKGSNFLAAVLITAAILILTLVGYMQSEKYIKNIALDGCYQMARVQEVDKKSGKTLDLPENYWFTRCLEKKGYPELAK